jgi:hypothetical protein
MISKKAYTACGLSCIADFFAKAKEALQRRIRYTLRQDFF